MQTKNKTLNVLNLFSIISLMLLNVPYTSSVETIRYILEYIVIGIILWLFISDRLKNTIYNKKICLAFSIVIDILLINNWRINFECFLEKIDLFSNKSLITTLTAVGLFIFSIPTIYYFIDNAIKLVYRICEKIDIKLIINRIKEEFRLLDFLKTVLIIFICITIGFFMMIAINKIGSERIECNVKESATVLYNEGKYPDVYDWCRSKLDNYTDSLIFLECIENKSDSILNKAMLNYRGSINEKDPYETLIETQLSNAKYDSYTEYSRYWHGCLLFVKPLLLFFNYTQIRTINFVLQVLMCSLIVFLLKRKSLKKYVIPYILSILILNPLVISKNIAFSICYYIFSISSILVIIEKKNRYWLLFLISGILTAYFDFLTYPISTFGIPAVFYLLIKIDEKFENKLIQLVKCGINWCAGYIFMWFGKWVLATKLTGINVIESGINQVRTRTDIINNYPVSTINKNIIHFFENPVTIIMIIMIVYIYQRINLHDICNENNFVFLLISISPLVWYIFACNHSNIHSFFTSKALIVTAFSILCMLKSIDIKKKEN